MALQRRTCIRGQFYLLSKVCGGRPGPASVSTERKEEIALFVDVQAHLTNDFLEDIGSCASLRDSSFLHDSSRLVHE